MDPEALVRNLCEGFFHRDASPADVQHWVSRLANGLSADELAAEFLRTKEFDGVRKKLRSLFAAPGHFYSPIVDVESIRQQFQAFTKTPLSDALPAIHIRRDDQIRVWKELVPFLKDIPFPDEKSPEYRYHFTNPAFSYGDGGILHAMLRRFRPRRLVEVGSGWSSACAIDTIDGYLDGAVDVSFVEPFPELLIGLLGEDTVSRVKIHANAVQSTDMEVFKRLESGDFLFIDSTHVMKTGSDVCHELFNILPALNPGVFVHFHDIFWPFEYGQDWVLKENRSWNEIYGLHAFLMYNNAFEIMFFNHYFGHHCRDLVQSDYPAMLKNIGGSIWLRKTGDGWPAGTGR
ncbi:MAG: class I SAM-dependent methyltransferase [Thiocapsa sp.]|jgi:hypothetical protein|nr:class I SAM-dependent methyltransferase [Thiocapsa sp.]MCG6895768.1 class I SAM-dependent methyltransferase [Thiocapsa sp.]MCG6984221.1 class I SAM-dependent methyltransferase [Thiocapsa sp.]